MQEAGLWKVLLRDGRTTGVSQVRRGGRRRGRRRARGVKKSRRRRRRRRYCCRRLVNFSCRSPRISLPPRRPATLRTICRPLYALRLYECGAEHPADPSTGDLAGAEEDRERETPTASHRRLDSASQTRTDNTEYPSHALHTLTLRGQTLGEQSSKFKIAAFRFRRALTLEALQLLTMERNSVELRRDTVSTICEK